MVVVSVKLSENQKKKLVKGDVSLCLSAANVEGDDEIVVSIDESKKLLKARENGKGCLLKNVSLAADVSGDENPQSGSEEEPELKKKD
jgi:hypothetical protein